MNDDIDDLEKKHRQFIENEKRKAWQNFIQPYIDSGETALLLTVITQKIWENEEIMNKLKNADKKLFKDIQLVKTDPNDHEFCYRLFSGMKHADDAPFYINLDKLKKWNNKIEKIRNNKKLNQTTIHKIDLENLSIKEIVESFGIPLTKNGSSLKTNCVFHSEKTPSLFINEEKQFFHCFGCGKSGKAVNFVMYYLNVSFKEACNYIFEKGLSP